MSIGEVDIIHPLCYNLTKIEKSEAKLLLEMINSLGKLLGLDAKFSNILQGENTVWSMVLRIQGFEAIEKL